MFTLYLHDEPEEPRGEYRSMRTARREAVALAASFGLPVEVCTRDDRGKRRVRVVIHPEGRAAPPPGAEVPAREACVAHEGRVCFCTPCRAERHARD